MPKYNVTLKKHMSYTCDFSIDAKNEEEIINKLNNMDWYFLEDQLKWVVSDYVNPSVDSIESVDENSTTHKEVSDDFYIKFNNR